jgi:hypothetical protein
VPCATTYTLVGTGVPITDDWYQSGYVAPGAMPAFAAGCVVTDVVYTVAFTSDTSFGNFASRFNLSVVRMGDTGTSIESVLLQKTAASTNLPAAFSGLALGSTCGSLMFQANAASFTTAVQPYTGTYAPAGEGIKGDTSAFLANSQYVLYIDAGTNVGPKYTLVCWKMTVTMQ